MTKASPPKPSHELIGKLITAGHLQPGQRDDPDAIAKAIAQLRQALRSGPEDEGPTAA